MDHIHAAHHGHSHGNSIVLKNINNAFIAGIILNFVFVIIEAGVGLYIDSLSLLSDAGHNLADVGSLALSLLAFRLLKVKPNERFTYGYRKTSILAALFNAVILLVSIGAIAYEAIHRFIKPEPLPGKTIAIVAGIGIIINTVTALLFFRDKEKDMNIKSAYLHLVADAIVSFALVIGGIIILFTGWYWVDPLMGIIVAVVILLSTWNLLKDSLRLSLDGVPKNVDMHRVKEEALRIKGVKNIHHIHVWAMSTTENAMTVHMIFNKGIGYEEEQLIKARFRHEMEHHNIHHVTIETERTIEDCKAEECL